MGWANCGTDSQGRPIGYAHEGECDHPECSAKIDRGLAFACGGMHGDDSIHGNTGLSCEKYFCGDHMNPIEVSDQLGEPVWIEVCTACAKKAPTCTECEQPSWALEGTFCRTCVETITADADNPHINLGVESVLE